jgi:hypothetical protein
MPGYCGSGMLISRPRIGGAGHLLALLVQEDLDRDAFAGSVFVFRAVARLLANSAKVILSFPSRIQIFRWNPF